MPTASDLGRPVELLLAAGSPSDADLIQAALKTSAMPINVHLVVDGVESMQFLRHEGVFADRPRPDFLILDLNMPRKDGRQVLAEIRADERFDSLPVAVLATSSAPDDVAQIYELKANCYLQKPVDLTEFMDAIKSLDDFWFTYATLPSKVR